jgi:hypothetical protein
VSPPRERHTHIRWGVVFRDLTDWTDRPVDCDDLRRHLEYRSFAPDDPDVIESLIEDAVSSGILIERGDGSLEYDDEFVTISLSIGGEARIEADKQ